MKLTVLPETFAVCRLDPSEPLPAVAFEGAFASVTRTGDELSVVCEERLAPRVAKVETGWRALKVDGPLDFSLTGILASLAGALARADVSLFALSTFDTDFLLVRATALDAAAGALRAEGHDVVPAAGKIKAI